MMNNLHKLTQKIIRNLRSTEEDINIADKIIKEEFIEAMHSSKPSQKKEWPCRNNNCPNEGQYWCEENFKFCPVCGTPRPVEKSLAEKFEKWLRTPVYDKTHDCNSAGAELAKIAEEHFRQL